MEQIIFKDSKNYIVKTYKNSCPIDFKDKFNNSNFDDILENGYKNISRRFEENPDIFFNDKQFFSEDDFVERYGDPFSEVNMTKEKVFIEEGDEKISIKYKKYNNFRNLGDKYFKVRKTTYFLTFNYRTKIFYYGSITSKKKKIVSKKFNVNPRHHVVLNYISISLYGLEKDKDPFMVFFDKIWEKLGIKNEEYMRYYNQADRYKLTYYIVNNIKIPNKWLKLNDMFYTKKVLKKHNFNLVDVIMKDFNLKGAKIKRMFNSIENLSMSKVCYLYFVLGIDKFNKIPDELFEEKNEQESLNNVGHVVPTIEDWVNSTYFRNTCKKHSQVLSKKEKECIESISKHINTQFIGILSDHVNLKLDLMDNGVDVKFKFKNIDEFHDEHNRFSELLDTYRKGDIVRSYGDYQSIEDMIMFEGKEYYPVVLKTSKEYINESIHQSHCVRTYSERPDSIIISIRQGNKEGNERVTVEYQFRLNNMVIIQERDKYNKTPKQEFSLVSEIILNRLNILYKEGLLTLPKIVKTYPNGRTIESQSTFKRVVNDDNKTVITSITPVWDKDFIGNNDMFYEVVEDLNEQMYLDSFF